MPLLNGPRSKLWRAWRRSRGIDTDNFAISPEEAVKAGAADTEIGRLLFQRDRGIFKWTQYLPAYETELSPYRGRPVRVLEIGVFEGGSLDLWREYFGADSTIYGIDIDPRCQDLDVPGVTIRLGSQDDPAFLRSVVAEMGGVDIVLDDGSHVAKDQRIAFSTLFPLMQEGGMYVVEDLQTAYWRGPYAGGYRRRGTFVEVAKQLVDDMHSWYHTKRQRSGVNASHTVERVTFYDGMVFIKKAVKDRPAVFHIDASSG